MSGSELQSGSLLKNGEYRIEHSLGQGGFGITYEAEQLGLGRRVAIKEFFMKDSCERDENTSHVTVPTASNRELVSKFKDKFIREARMIAGLNNEHIVKIFDVFEENGTAYYVMEFLGSGSLDRKIKGKGAMSEKEAVGFIRQIADALEYLHSQNILHFDVKPSNVLLGKNGSTKLIDFGISKHYDEAGVQTSSTPVGISKGFAPLEQYQQSSDIKSFTPATDIYSLGATLFALLTGSNPPEASIVNEDGIPVIDGISPVVMRAIEKSMQPRRKDRPQSVAEFLAILDGTAEEDDSEQTIVPASTAKEPNPEKAGTPARKSKGFPKWLYGLIAGVAVAVLAAVLLNRPDKTDAPDNLQADSTAVVSEAKPEPPVTSKPSPSVTKPESPVKPETPAVIELKSISLSKTTLELEEGSSATLTVKYTPGNATDKTTTWKSSDASVVKVSTSGKVTAVKAGAATIIVRCGDKESTCAVSVKRKVIEVESIILDKKSLILEEGQSANLTVEYSPENATDRTTTWESSNSSVAKVSTNGKVTAVKAGSTVIVAACQGNIETCTVIVKTSGIGTHAGHEWVDLGLSVKWATCNVGASSPAGYGSYFAWGETSPKNDYSWSTLKYCTGGDDSYSVKFSKYVTDRKYGPVDNKTHLELSDDAARANWGGSWRMPTSAEQDELREKCTWTWTTQGGHVGYKVTSKSNGNSIFLPAAGHLRESGLVSAGSEGNYWSSSLSHDGAHGLYFDEFGVDQAYNLMARARYYGHNMRPVCP